MPVRVWLRPPRQLFLLFVAVIVVPAATLAWLASRTFEQDRALERQSVQDRLDHATTQVVAGLRQRLDALGTRLAIVAAGPDANLPAGAVLFTAGEDSVRVRPEHRLLYYPRVPANPALPDAALAAAESLEHRGRNPAAAAEAFRQLARRDNPAQRAAALTGLARCLRKTGRADAALDVYNELARVDAKVDDVPAALAARHARASVLVEMKRPGAATEAAALLADLHHGRWILDRASYEMYEQETRAWLREGATLADPALLSLSEAIATLDRERPWNGAGAREGRTALWAHGQPLLVVWRLTADGAMALLVPAGWLRESAASWGRLNVSIGVADLDGHIVLGNPAALAGPLVVRRPADTGLPWVVHVASANPAIDAAAFATRRQLVLGIVLFVAFLVFGAAIIVMRSYARDLAVRRTQAEFVATVSHEFRSPLTSMSHLIEMLESGDVVAQDRQHRYYTVLGRETRRLRRLVENLLDFRRMEVGRVEYRRDTIDARELVRQVADEFATELGSRDRLVVALDDTPAPLVGDREALGRAVWNLLDNAAKYSPPASPIALHLRVHDGSACIVVSDRGPGIPPTEQAEIFRPFYRGASASASAIKGTGIGLATVAHIVRAHDGDIHVDSAAGGGSRFTLSLPLQTEASRVIEPAVERID